MSEDSRLVNLKSCTRPIFILRDATGCSPPVCFADCGGRIFWIKSCDDACWEMSYVHKMQQKICNVYEQATKKANLRNNLK